MRDFKGLGITTVDEALQGRIAGLDIVFDSGNLGARSQMRLRGGVGAPSEDALFVKMNEPSVESNSDQTAVALRTALNPTGLFRYIVTVST